MVTLHNDAFKLLRGYSALLPPKTMTFPNHLPLADVHSFLVDSVLLGQNLPHLQAYPPSKIYQYTFWKWAIGHLENMATDEDDFNIDDRLYTHLITLLPTSPSGLLRCGASGPPPQSYVTQYWKTEILAEERIDLIDTIDYQTTTLLESRTTIENGTTGLRTWFASQVLAQYLISHPEYVVNKRIIELGSGTGFLGIIVASLQLLHHSGDEGFCSTGSLWLTDVNDSVLARCRDNVQLPCNSSSLHPSVNYRSLDWSDALNSVDAFPLVSFLQEIKSDLVLGADLVFDPSLIPALVGTLKIALRSGVEALIALTVRNEDTLASFLTTADKLLKVEELCVQLNNSVFLGMSEGQLDSGMEVRMFRISMKG